jgi:hypothetical protein
MAAATKLTPARQRVLVDAVAAGATYEQAAMAAGVTYETLRVWRKTIPAFSAALKKGEVDAMLENLALIKQAAEEQEWTAAAWLLERRWPQQWGRLKRVEVTAAATVHLGRLLETVAQALDDVLPPEDWQGRERLAQRLLELDRELDEDEEAPRVAVPRPTPVSATPAPPAPATVSSTTTSSPPPATASAPPAPPRPRRGPAPSVRDRSREPPAAEDPRQPFSYNDAGGWGSDGTVQRAETVTRTPASAEDAAAAFEAFRRRHTNSWDGRNNGNLPL